MSHYSNDPRWITARFNSKCSKCKTDIRKGENIFYYPSTKSAFGKSCGCADDASANFNAAAFDEDVLYCR